MIPAFRLSRCEKKRDRSREDEDPGKNRKRSPESEATGGDPRSSKSSSSSAELGAVPKVRGADPRVETGGKAFGRPVFVPTVLRKSK